MLTVCFSRDQKLSESSLVLYTKKVAKMWLVSQSLPTMSKDSWNEYDRHVLKDALQPSVDFNSLVQHLFMIYE